MFRFISLSLTLSCSLVLSSASPALAARSAVPEAQAAKERGDAAANANNFTAAEAAYREALAKDPQFFDAAMSLGEALFNMERFPDAAVAFQAALAIRTDESARYNLAYSLRKAGKYAEAITHYRTYLKSKSTDADAYYGLAESEMLNGNKKEAAADFRRYVELEKRPSEAEWVQRAKDNADRLEKELAAPPPQPASSAPAVVAVPVSSSSSSAAPTVAAAPIPESSSAAPQKSAPQHIADGDAYLGAKSYAKAQTSYRAALAIDPSSEEAYYKLGLAFAFANDFGQAAAAFERVLALNPGNSAARQNLERARAKLAAKAAGITDGNFDAAEGAYARGVSLMRQQDYLGALAAFDETLRFRQDHALCYVARGTAYIALKDPRRAVTEYSKAITFDATLASPYFGLGEAYRHAGDRGQALVYYSRYLDIKGRDKDPATIERAKRWVAELQQ